MKKIYTLVVLFIIFLSKAQCEYMITTYPTTDIQIINHYIKQLQKHGFYPELKIKNWEGRSFYYIILGRYDSYEIAYKVLLNLKDINISFEILLDGDEQFDYELASSDEILSVLKEDKKIAGILRLDAKGIKIKSIDKSKIEDISESEREKENNQFYESSKEERHISRKISEIGWELRKDGFRVETEIENKDNSILVGIYNSINSANDMKREMEGYGYQAKVREERGNDKTLFYVFVLKSERKENSEIKKNGLNKIPAKRLKDYE